MNPCATVRVLIAAAFFLIWAPHSKAVVPPSADWIEVQRYTNGASNGKFHVVYLIPNGRTIYMVRISNFTDMGPSTIEKVQSFELGAPVPPGRSWMLIQRYEKNPSAGEGEVQFQSVFALASGSEVHVIRASNINGWVLERLPSSPVTLP